MKSNIQMKCAMAKNRNKKKIDKIKIKEPNNNNNNNNLIDNLNDNDEFIIGLKQ